MKNIFRKNISKIYKYSKIYDECFWLNKFINTNSISLILDVGANTGQYASSLRRFGYKKKIISFEPGKDAYSELIKNSKKDNQWRVFEKIALGNKSGSKKLNISKNSVSSSFRVINEIHLVHELNAKYIKNELSKIIKLDGIFKKFYKKDKNIMLKIDTQGFEWEVLQGSKKSLKNIKIIQLELSFIELYSKQYNWLKTLNFLEKNNFKVFKIIDGFKNKKSGQVMQSDFFLINTKFIR